jgi:Required for nuclear transport of RNA pol II C-terminus 1
VSATLQKQQRTTSQPPRDPSQPPSQPVEVRESQSLECVTLLERFSDLKENVNILYIHAKSKLGQRLLESSSIVESCCLADRSHVLHHDDDENPWLVPQQPLALENDERLRLVHEILLPLLATLGMCYQLLDQIPSVTQPTLPQDTHQHNTTPSTTGSRTTELAANVVSSICSSLRKPSGATRTKLPPAPPIAMLSIQNYTNVACVVELVVGWGMLPLMPPKVLSDMHVRTRYQWPRAVRGRLPASCLTWGGSGKVSTGCSTPALVACWHDLVVVIVGQLLLLDRFRPMLLPRHLPDLMATILHRQHLQPIRAETSSSTRLDALVQRLSAFLLGGSGSSGTLTDLNATAAETTVVAMDNMIDPYWQVKSYQTLLRHGRESPTWLRTAVSQLLCTMATTHLAVVLAAFVHDAVHNGDNATEGTAAMARLARAIVPLLPQQPTHNRKPTKRTAPTRHDHESYLDLIARQLVQLLDAAASDRSLHDHSTSSDQLPLPMHHVINVHAVWAILDLLPTAVLNGAFYDGMVDLGLQVASVASSKNLGDDSRVDWSRIHAVVLRFAILFRHHPSAATAGSMARVCRLWWKRFTLMDSNNGSLPCTLVGVLVRLASTPCICKSLVKDDTIAVLRLFVEACMAIDFAGTDQPSSGKASGRHVVAVSLLQALAPISLDLNGWSFELSNSCDPASDGTMANQVWLQKDAQVNETDISRHVERIEGRVRVLLRDILVFRGNSSSEDQASIEKHESDHDQLLPLLFRILLIAYIAPEGIAPAQHENGPPSLFRHAHFQIVPLVCLPVLCEASSLEFLFEADGGILEIIRLVLASVLDRLTSDSPRSLRRMSSEQSTGSLFEMCAQLALANGIVYPEDAENRRTASLDEQDEIVAADVEMLLSVTSIVLSLLISILELGVRNRSYSDEAILQSMAPLLRSMSTRTSIGLSCDDASILHDQMSEMASYAAALLATRAAPIRNPTSETSSPRAKSILDDLACAESDLLSSEPPLRARGMVALRKLVQSQDPYLPTHQHVPGHNQNWTDHLWKVLQLSIRALSDHESFVYLAAVHTIVTVAEADPSVFVPVLGSVIATGRLSEKLCLNHVSVEQRVKLSEALCFTIRRRGSFGRELLIVFHLLACGPKPLETGTNDDKTEAMQLATHEYFVLEEPFAEYVKEADDQAVDMDEYWKGVDLRARTGGPLFNVEEEEVIRAATITLVAELLSVVSREVTASYCAILMDCCITTLQLESSRPIRRAGATLSRELYAALVREQDDLLCTLSDCSTTNSPRVPLSVAMVAGREDILCALLRRVVDSNDSADNMGRLHDPATAARCQEALSLRDEAASGGILTAGRIVRESNMLRQSRAVANFLVGSRQVPRIVPLEVISFSVDG